MIPGCCCPAAPVRRLQLLHPLGHHLGLSTDLLIPLPLSHIVQHRTNQPALPAPSLQDCSAALDLHPQYAKALLRRSTAYEKLDDLERALADAQKVGRWGDGRCKGSRQLVHRAGVGVDGLEWSRQDMPALRTLPRRAVLHRCWGSVGSSMAPTVGECRGCRAGLCSAPRSAFSNPRACNSFPSTGAGAGPRQLHCAEDGAAADAGCGGAAREAEGRDDG